MFNLGRVSVLNISLDSYGFTVLLKIVDELTCFLDDFFLPSDQC